MGASCESVKASDGSTTTGTLTYFKGVHARGEPIRILLAYKGVKYVAEDLTMEDFAARKAAGKFISG